MRYHLHFPHSTHDVVHLVAMMAAAALIVGIPVLVEYYIFNTAYVDPLQGTRQMIMTPFAR
ncbi:MAG TPA: hypothetical protein VD978_17715 [Azospirillum sp.]|nr:hypothetical protein [Azospirillum sp.]